MIAAERDLQRAIVEYLALALVPPAIATAFPAGGGGRVRGAILAGMGLRAGWPDLQIVHDGRYHGLEVKTRTGRLSSAQIATHRAIIAAGGAVAVVRSLDEVAAALDGWRIPIRARLAA